jgi:hypothetical protein
MSAAVSALLIDAPVGRHFAQLHRNMSSVVASAGLFIETGLRRGNGVIALATRNHTARFLEHLSRSGIDAARARRAGQLVIRDADEMLSQIMNGGGIPDWRKFQDAVGTVIEGVIASGFPAVRAYGELVNVLWRDGRAAAAIRLEDYWNELAKFYPFSLFCGYMIDGHEHDAYHHPLHEIGRTHTDVIATTEDEQLRFALEAVSKDVFGIPLDGMVRFAHMEDYPGEQRLPEAHRAMLWMVRHLPGTSREVLKRAKRYLAASA